MSYLLRMCIASLLALLIVATTYADDIPKERLDLLDSKLQKWQTEYKIPGLAIVVVHKGEPILMKGYGVADIKTERPVTPETIFAIGSTTKAFTAALIAMEIDQGDMAWDDPITKFLPDFELQIETDQPDAHVVITDLLAHRTGFTRMGLLWASGQASRDLILKTATGAEPMAPFRDRFLYNNVMYMAAGQGLAKAAGHSWEDLVKQQIFVPLGMTSSNTSLQAAHEDPNLALGYIWNEDEQEFEPQKMRELASVAAAGAINSNIKDMAQWLRLQLGKGQIDGKRLIDAARLEEMWQGQIEIAGGMEYALGWMVHNEGEDRIVEHGGNIDGFAASVAMRPQDELGYVLLCNVSATPLQGMYESVFDLLLEDQVETESPVDVAQSSEKLDRYVGVYKANFGTFVNADFTVSTSEGKLFVDIPGQMNFELVAPDDEGRRYFAITREIFITFDEDDQGHVIGLRLHQRGLAFDLPREGVEIVAEIPLAQLEPYLGTYEGTGLSEGSVYTVLVQNTRLAVDVPGQMIYELDPPDASGRRAFRVKDNIGVSFKAGEQPDSMTMTLMQPEGAFAYHRTKKAVDNPLPTLAELDEQRGTKRRGEALARAGVVALEATVNFKQSGIIGKTRQWFSGTDRSRVDFDFGTFGSIQTALDGDIAAENSSFDEFRELSGKMLRQAKQSHPGAYLGNWHDFFESITILRRDEVDGQPAIALRLENEGAPAVEIYVDVKTGDVVQMDTVAIEPGMGEFPMTAYFRDYREVRGIRLPYQATLESIQSGEMVTEIQDVKTNLKIGNGIFRLAPPASSQASP